MAAKANQRRVGVIGGGLLGLSLSLRLREAGFAPTILEAGPRPGGLASPASIGEYAWDRFYHVILMSDSHTLALV